MATENEFRRLLREHLQKTRAGLYGQFEHGWNFVPSTGNADLKIGPGETITFTGELTDGREVVITAQNNLTGPAGHAFVAQQANPNDSTIVVGADSQTGQAVLNFNVPSVGASETTSYDKGRGLAIDESDANIFTSPTGQSYEIVRSEAGDWYLAQDGGLGFRRTVAKFAPNGSLTWAGGWEFDDRLVAHDPVNEVCATFSEQNLPNGVDGAVVRGYDADFAGPVQGGPSEPPLLWATQVAGPANRRATRDLKAGAVGVVGSDGFFYVLVQENDGYDGATPTVPKNLLKIDGSNGAIVATYDTGAPRYIEARLAVDPANGDVVVAQERPGYVPEDGGAAANVLKFDKDLTLIARYDVDWSVAPYGSAGRFVHVAIDDTSQIYLCSGSGYGLQFDSGLTTENWSKQLVTGLSSSADRVWDLGHNQNGKLVAAGGSGAPTYAATLWRYDNAGDPHIDGHFTDGGGTIRQLHILPGAATLAASENTGTLFTSEPSTNPPGKIPAIAAVKYVGEDIVGIYFNSVEVQFDPEKWTAEHDINGNINVDVDWEYNSPL